MRISSSQKQSLSRVGSTVLYGIGTRATARLLGAMGYGQFFEDGIMWLVAGAPSR
jgi:hypothetical protein